MRILYSHRTRSSDGQYVHIEALTRALVRLGHDVLICGPEGTAPAGGSRRSLSVGDETDSRLRIPYGLYELAEMAYNFKSVRSLERAARTFQPDVIYERYNLFHHAGDWANRKLKLPRLLEVNAPIADERAKNGELRLVGLGRRSENQLWRSADRVLPVTAVLGDMVAARGVDWDRISVIPNGVDDRTLVVADPDPIREKYGLGTALVLGFVGFVRDWHGVDRVIDWLASEAGRGASLLLVGDGPATPALHEQAARLGVADRFIVTGVVQRQEVAAHVAAFDIALQPAVTPYASPLKLQEYMAQARAIIAPDAANIRETVTHGQDALLIDEQAPDALAAALTKLASDSTLRNTLGSHARQTLLRRDMTWTANARRVISLAETLLDQRPR
ncbi:MAG: glycosyltransferase [Parvularcula sp.]